MPKKTVASTTKKRSPARAGESVPLMPSFVNKAGRYELIRVEGDQAFYSFTNLQGRTVDAVMTPTMWRQMQARRVS